MPFICKAVSQDCHAPSHRDVTAPDVTGPDGRLLKTAITQPASIKTVNMQSRNFSNLFRHVLGLKHFHYFLGCFSITGPDPLAHPPKKQTQKKHTKTRLQKRSNTELILISVSFTSLKLCHFKLCHHTN